MDLILKFFITFFTLQGLILSNHSILGRRNPRTHPAVQQFAPANRTIFRAYIGSNFNNVAFTDVPIHTDVEFHFILSFAIDYTAKSCAFPTNGKFNIFWDSDTLNPAAVIAIKKQHKNVKVVLSLGGDTCGDIQVNFTANSVKSWVSNAVSSLTKIIKDYNLDGIDIDYEHYQANPNIFAQCIGQLVTQLKGNGVISLASIAPYDDEDVQSHYQKLWKSYSNVFDYVNFQFYAYDKGTTVSQFMGYFDQQCQNYHGGKIMASFATDAVGGGLTPENGFFEACKKLKSKGILAGIFIWSADDSKDAGFPHEKQSQALLASDAGFTI